MIAYPIAILAFAVVLAFVVRGTRKPAPKPSPYLATAPRKPPKVAPKPKRKRRIGPRASWRKGSALKDRLFDELASDPGRDFDAVELAARVGSTKKSVWSALSVMQAMGTIARTGHGRYQYAGKAGGQ